MTYDDELDRIPYCTYPGCDEDLIQESIEVPDINSTISQTLPVWVCPNRHPIDLTFRYRDRTPL